jgi:hypothetical protein
MVILGERERERDLKEAGISSYVRYVWGRPRLKPARTMPDIFGAETSLRDNMIKRSIVDYFTIPYITKLGPSHESHKG